VFLLSASGVRKLGRAVAELCVCNRRDHLHGAELATIPLCDELGQQQSGSAHGERLLTLAVFGALSFRQRHSAASHSFLGLEPCVTAPDSHDESTHGYRIVRLSNTRMRMGHC
jgi:hypothetical protein